MSRRLSPKQLNIFHELIHGKHILDVGDENSQFLATEFARYSRSWTVVGRTLPTQNPLPHTTFVPEKFDAWNERPDPESIDIILLAFSSPDLAYDAACLQWATPKHTIIFFGDPTDDKAHGSPAFWKFVRGTPIQKDEKDVWSRMLVIQKKAESVDAEESSEEAHTSHGRHPKKGTRYRLAASFRWPGKKPGERPPIVEITSHWEKNSGPAKIVGTGEVLRLHSYDLGARM